MCTKDETISTGISIETVRESKWKPHNTLSDSESIHLNNCKDTGILFKPTSKKATRDSKVVIIMELIVIICDPEIPTFLPKNPETIDPNKGRIIIAKYIIYTLLQYYLLICKMQLEYLDL